MDEHQRYLRSQLKEMTELQARLAEFPKRLRRKLVVPLSELSFVEGDILQTNEIFVLLGADYFVRTSTYNAGKILQRRKVALEEAIKKSSVYDIGDVSGKQLNNLTDEEAEHEEVIKKLAKLEALEQTTQMGKEKSEDSFTEAFSGVVKEKTANDAGLTQQFSWKKGKNDEKNRVSRFRQLRS